MSYSDTENYSDAEIFSDGDIEPDDLFNDEAEEDGDDRKSIEEEGEKKPIEEPKVKPVERKRQRSVVKNPRVTLNFDTLRGSNGLSALKKLFKDFQFKGNGHEKEDLTRIMTILQQWMSYQLCPSYSFESCMLQLENLGKKKVVQTLMKKYRSGIDDWGESQLDEKENERMDNAEEEMWKNEFDTLLDKEIASARSDGEFSEEEDLRNAQQVEEVTLTPEQLERIARNRKLAEDRRLKRMNQQGSLVEMNQWPTQTDKDMPQTTVLEENN